MNNQYEIEYQVTLSGGKALVFAPSDDAALDAFYSSDESIKQLKEPTPETTVKRITKVRG